jgi:LDH2 family malate/lactate/ureidoglycolate dehydrogenase
MSAKYTTVNPQKLMAFSTKILENAGVPPQDAAITARLLVNTDLRGISSHGVAHLDPFYIKRIKEGSINVKPNIKTWSNAPTNAVIDGDRGLGFVVAYQAMQEAIARAKVTRYRRRFYS